jgi:hypothetical protein
MTDFKFSPGELIEGGTSKTPANSRARVIDRRPGFYKLFFVLVGGAKPDATFVQFREYSQDVIEEFYERVKKCT